MSQESWTQFLTEYGYSNRYESAAFCKALDDDALWVYGQLRKRHPELKSGGHERLSFRLYKDDWWVELQTEDLTDSQEISLDSIWYDFWKHSQEYNAAFGSIERESERRFKTLFEIERLLQLKSPYFAPST
jgi:hypothetical protein